MKIYIPNSKKFFIWSYILIYLGFLCCAVLCGTHSYPTLCDIDGSLPGSSVHGIFQARLLEWVAISYSRDLPNPRIKPESLASLALADGFLSTEPFEKPIFRFMYF